MKRRTVLLAASGVLCAVAFAIMWRPSLRETTGTPIPADAATIARGARVVAQGDCIVCHTAREGTSYAGGYGLKTPFGTIYSTNITPDAATGIGRWSVDAFRRALRHGVSRDGHFLYPAFPYVHYTRMADADIDDAYAFLMSRRPVDAPPRKNELPLLFRLRPSLAFWNLLFLKSGAVPAGRGVVERGRYLAEGAGHCASCHTPLDFIGGEEHGKPYDGATVDGWDAPPLNRLDSATRPWTQGQLVDYLSTGVASEHGAAAGPMRPVVDNLSKLPRADVEAIASYVLSLQKPRGVRNDTPVNPSMPAGYAEGASLFAGGCAGCHEPSAPMMAMEGRPSLDMATSIHADTPRNAIQTIVNGIGLPDEPGVSVYMPSFDDALSNRDIANLLVYLRVRFGKKEPWRATNKIIEEVGKDGSAPP
ncbi:mono/diheme cytochrome c family protein [Luteibacter rhizovicinus]|uniref:Mono/diheme cytochrome c family protein n=1 Tax=Luteibacter rhizovicinus TaxID=242606 RepID=A0A4R3YME4_9GAMM|nr:c-type cytochrome [Luteibacter rhizovicinus]TCV93441.1 mono/diheme cytochrome c family protein [Luteibacter rhizovicinus]